MADSIAVIEARLRTEYPFPQHDVINGEPVEMSAERYAAWISDQAVSIREAQLEAEAEAQRAEIRRLTRLALARMEANYQLLTGGGNLSATEQRRISGETTQAVYWLIRILIDKQIIEAS